MRKDSAPLLGHLVYRAQTLQVVKFLLAKGSVLVPLIIIIGMYGPPPNCKRKIEMTVWCAPMYSAFGGV